MNAHPERRGVGQVIRADRRRWHRPPTHPRGTERSTRRCQAPVEAARWAGERSAQGSSSLDAWRGAVFGSRRGRWRRRVTVGRVGSPDLAPPGGVRREIAPGSWAGFAFLPGTAMDGDPERDLVGVGDQLLDFDRVSGNAAIALVTALVAFSIPTSPGSWTSCGRWGRTVFQPVVRTEGGQGWVGGGAGTHARGSRVPSMAAWATSVRRRLLLRA
jgi:hypothetical protein